MYLSKLEIFGFKSFAHKVTFQFKDGITAIIGPNGCGKSNIVDAIRWVLGEQRPSLLRLERMENVIFNGAVVRRPLGLVEVSILIENTKNILPAIFSEVKITRRFYRSGESDYLINNRQVRLKDIIDLFTDTGMGSDAYSVIELKMVEQILSDNAEERRRLFEEAAGIKKYKFRRKAALRKLDTVNQELVRLNDVMGEVQKTVNSLSRQVAKARRYHQYKEELKIHELYTFQLKTRTCTEDLLPLREEFEQVRQTRERLGKEVNQKEVGLEKLQLKSVNLESEFRKVTTHLNGADEKVREIQQKVQLNDQKIESIKQNISARKNEIIQLEYRIKELSEQLSLSKIEEEKIAKNVVSKELNYQNNLTMQTQEEAHLAEIRKEYNSFREQNLHKLSEINTNRDEFQKILLKKDNALRQKKRLEEIVKKLESDLSEINAQEDNFRKDLEALTAQEELTQQKIRKYQQRVDKLEEEDQILETQRNKLLGEYEKFKGKKEFLQSLIQNYEGFSESVQFIMSKKRDYHGLIDTLANLVDTKEEFRPALENFLEELANYLVVEEIDTAKNILREVRAQGKGRLTLIPLSNLNSEHNGSSTKNDFNGSATPLSKVVNYDPRFDKLFHLLFDRVLLVEDMEEALKLYKQLPEFKFVTREGEILGDFGSIRGGNSHYHLNLTGRKTEFDNVLKKWKKLEQDTVQLARRIKENQSRLNKERLDLHELEEQQKTTQQLIIDNQQKLHQLNFESNRLSERMNDIMAEIKLLEDEIQQLSMREKELTPQIQEAEKNAQLLLDSESHLREEYERVEQNYHQIMREVQELHIQLLNEQNFDKETGQRISFIEQSLQETRERIQQTTTDIGSFSRDIAVVEQDNNIQKKQLDELYRVRDVIENEKNEVENNYQGLKSLILSREEEVKKLHRRWNQALERLKEIELKIQEIEIKQKAQEEQVREHFGDSLETLLIANPVPPDVDLAQLHEEIIKTKQRLESLGEVNPLAIKEYDKEKERLDFMQSQLDDLLKAKEELLETISKLNKTAQKQFMETFEKIAENFRAVFSKFFEGGQAELYLIENEDPLEGDIDISVHLKGRKLTTLSLLSAGEKTLTAISLLFAIYLYKPSPFCILDEVDAPLDDVNISRYTHALKEFSKNTQFILVTHNKMTMQAAQALYGITMEEPGVSKVVSVRFD
jgi:chromosome segregation protein